VISTLDQIHVFRTFITVIVLAKFILPLRLGGFARKGHLIKASLFFFQTGH